MNIFELKRLIREEVVKATKDGPYGSYLFGQSRKLPNEKKQEIDTSKEKELNHDLWSQYHGRMDDLSKWIPLLDKLEKEGKYKDILTVPCKYQHAYRMMSEVSLSHLTNILGQESAGYKTREIYRKMQEPLFQ